MASVAYKRVYNEVIKDALEDVNVDKLSYIEDFVDLPESVIEEIFAVLWVAIRNVMVNLVADKKDVILPFIGRFKIKDRRKVLDKHLDKVVQKYGYQSIDKVKKSDFNKIQVEAHNLMNDELRNKPKPKRKVHEIDKPIKTHRAVVFSLKRKKD